VKVFFDECVPRPLRKLLSGHEIKTAQEMGWGRLKNGALIAEAEQGGFEVFVTSDQNLKYQQNLKRNHIGMLVLSTNFWPALREKHSEIAAALETIRAGEYRELVL
jgi:hypothetical protein